MRPLRVLTWHVHGNYMLYLSRARVEFLLPVRRDGTPGHGGRGSTFPFPPSVREIPAEAVREADFDCVLFQSPAHYREDQYELLSESQQRLPRIYLEHDPPLAHPTGTVHPVADRDVLIVHVTHYNALMWDCGALPTRVVEHGVRVPEGIAWNGERPRGVAVINHLRRRGRRLGSDVFDAWRQTVPLDLYGMDAQASGGTGELPYAELFAALSRYRFFAHPVRYTSLALAICEAMTIGLPVIGLATTELPKIIAESGGGYVDNDIARLIGYSRDLIPYHSCQ